MLDSWQMEESDLRELERQKQWQWC